MIVGREEGMSCAEVPGTTRANWRAVPPVKASSPIIYPHRLASAWHAHCLDRADLIIVVIEVGKRDDELGAFPYFTFKGNVAMVFFDRLQAYR